MEQDLRYTAIHEAAHAVVGLVVGIPIATVSIVPEPERGSVGRTRVYPLAPSGGPDAAHWQLMMRAVADLAGLEATRQLGGRKSAAEAGAEADYANARIALRCLAGGDDTNVLLREARVIASQIVAEAWSAIETVADRLLVAHRLSGREIGEILDRLDAAGTEVPPHRQSER